MGKRSGDFYRSSNLIYIFPFEEPSLLLCIWAYKRDTIAHLAEVNLPKGILFFPMEETTG